MIDTRSTHVQAREILDDLRELTADPVTVVVDTHGHFDHAFGNHVFRPATIWGHERCVTFLERTGEARRGPDRCGEPAIAADIAEVVIDPPDRTFAETAHVEVGGRRVELRYLGRGHTDHDIVISVPGRRRPVRRRPARERRGPVVRRRLSARLAGDGAARRGAGRPASWCPATATTPAGRSRRTRRRPFAALAELARRVHAGELTLDEAVAPTPFPEHPAEDIRRPLERALQQLRGELD